VASSRLSFAKSLVSILYRSKRRLAASIGLRIAWLCLLRPPRRAKRPSDATSTGCAEGNQTVAGRRDRAAARSRSARVACALATTTSTITSPPASLVRGASLSASGRSVWGGIAPERTDRSTVAANVARIEVRKNQLALRLKPLDTDADIDQDRARDPLESKDNDNSSLLLIPWCKQPSKKREIANFFARRSGRITDEFERELMRRLLTSNWSAFK
jgi:hypothetical protein